SGKLLNPVPPCCGTMRLPPTKESNMKRVVFLLILIQSLCLLPAAHSEDSWVLWERMEYTNLKTFEIQRVWDIIDGYAKEPDCKSGRVRAVAAKKKHFDDSRASNVKEVSGNETSVTMSTDRESWLYEYICLP